MYTIIIKDNRAGVIVKKQSLVEKDGITEFKTVAREDFFGDYLDLSIAKLIDMFEGDQKLNQDQTNALLTLE